MGYTNFELIVHGKQIIPFYKDSEMFIYDVKQKDIFPITDKRIRLTPTDESSKSGGSFEEIILNGSKFLIFLSSEAKPTLLYGFYLVKRYLDLLESGVRDYLELYKDSFREIYKVNLKNDKVLGDLSISPDCGIEIEFEIAKNIEFEFSYLKRLALHIPSGNVGERVPSLLHSMANKFQADFMSLVDKNVNSNSPNVVRSMNSRQRSAILTIVREMKGGQNVTNATVLASKKHNYSVRNLDDIKAKIVRGVYKCPEYTEVCKGI